MEEWFRSCRLCPRACGVNRLQGEYGVCRTGAKIMAARASLHAWEEPCLSGKNGSGTVFFSGCNLGCVYCQNRRISRAESGRELSTEQLCDLFFRLRERGAHNINLVTATHILPLVLGAVRQAQERGIGIPFVYNCGGYESVEALRQAEGLIDIYLPDFKYWSPRLARRYSVAPNYPDAARRALDEMVRQQPRCVFDADGMLRRGVLVRHMVLPGCAEDSKAVLQYLYERFGTRIYLSIMSQYTPPREGLADTPELARPLRAEEYDEVVGYAEALGIEQGFVQEGEAASESFIPDFDESGLL